MNINVTENLGKEKKNMWMCDPTENRRIDYIDIHAVCTTIILECKLLIQNVPYVWPTVHIRKS